jgi:hypothetical protein
VNDAEARLAERLATDLGRVLGTGILIEDLEIQGEGPVTINVACLVDGQVREISGEGETAQDAIGGVIRAAARLRQDGAFWQIVGPGF